MTPYQKNVNSYKNVQIKTASRERLLLMVYDGTLGFLKKARILISKGKAEKANTYLLSATNAVIELLGTLDYAKAPDFCKSMESLYMYVIERIRASLEDYNLKDLDEAIKVISSLKQSWEEAFQAMGVENPDNPSLAKTG